jgi:hypothetical protein
MVYQSTLVFHQYFQFGLGCDCSLFGVLSHVTENQQYRPQSLLAISGKGELYEERTVPLHHTYTPTHAGRELMLCDLQFGRFPSFFLLQVHKLNSSLF